MIDQNIILLAERIAQEFRLVRQAQSGSSVLTDAELRDFLLAVSGGASGGGLTDTQLRAAPVRVTGALTNTELRSDAVAVTGTVTSGGGSLGSGDITLDAWGIQKMSLAFSLFHGLFTFGIPFWDWLLYENGAEVVTSTDITSVGGAARLLTTVTDTALILESRVCPRNQPNRGHLFSTALWCPAKTNNGIREWGLQTANAGVFFRLKADGKLYAVIRSLNVETLEEEIITTDVAGFDVENGNVYDIQYQWRGVGNYKFFINLTLVHTIANLGTLTALSMSNPALPASFKATRTTQDVAMHIGCVDISSENGSLDNDTRGSALAEAVATTGADKPVLVVFNPLTIGGLVNTRTLHIHELQVLNSKKCTFKVWRTRDATGITGATLVAGYGGVGTYVQTDSTNMNAGAVRATAVTVAKLFFLDAISVEAAVSVEIGLGTTHSPIHLVRGDYLVITNDSTAGSSDVVIRWGEEV